jgi:hypothetical protein
MPLTYPYGAEAQRLGLFDEPQRLFMSGSGISWVEPADGQKPPIWLMACCAWA